MSDYSFWLVIFAAGVGTLLIRLVPILAHGRVRTPGVVSRLLRYVPAAAMASLIVPGALYVRELEGYSVSPPRVLAALLALVVAWRWRNVFATLACGMVALWIFSAVIPNG